MKFRSKACLAVACGFVAVAASAGVVRYVSPDATGAEDEDFTEDHPGTLANAIAASVARSSWADGDEIVLLPNSGSTKGVYDCAGLTPNETRCAYYFCDKAYLKIRGYSGKREDIEFRGKGSEDYRCFRVKNQTSFSGLTFKDFVLTLYLPKDVSRPGGQNVAPDSTHITGGGGAICSQNDAWGNVVSIVSNCAFSACRAGYGGAVQGCTVYDSLFQDCTFSGEYTSTGGGGVANGTCVGCMFDRCGSAADTLTKARGGATLDCVNSNCVFMTCRASSGAATGTSANFTETGGENIKCVFTNCTALSSGNGICVCGKSTGCLFVDNKGENLVYGLTRNCRIDRCLFVRNTVSGALLGGNVYNTLVVNNTNTDGNGGTGLFNHGASYNCTVVSNTLGGAATRYVIGNGSSAYNCLIAGNDGGNEILACAGPICNCTADRPIDATKSPSSRDFELDLNAVKGLRWGVDPEWGVSDVPVGIKGRASIKGRGSNLKEDETTEIWTETDVDYAGKPRLREGEVVDIGCYTYVPNGLMLLLR